MERFKKRLLITSSLALLILPVAPVLAEDGGGTSGSDTTSSTTENKTTSGQNSREAELEAQKEKADAKTQANKLKRCEDRQTDINKRLKNIATRGQKQLDLFTTIAGRTQKFYTDKNLTLSNYGDLVAAVNAKKAAAQVTIDKIAGDSVTFKCDGGTDPKTQLTQFKTDLKAEISALKEYRTSAKNLIVGVKSALGTQEKSNANG